MKTRSPKFFATAFTCPHCQVVAQMNWSPMAVMGRPLVDGYAKPHRNGWYMATCSACNNDSIWMANSAEGLQSALADTDAKMVWPRATVGPDPTPDFPEDMLKDYQEARRVANESPRAAAALLRLSIQRLCRHLGEPGHDISKDIGALVAKGLTSSVQKSLDAYFSDRGRPFQADRGRQISAVGDAPGRRASSGLNVSQSSTISLKRAVVGPGSGLGLVG